MSARTTVDPVTLEILRHRLDAINDDAAATLTQVSGSQIAVEANDMNTVIMTADGTVVSCGRYVLVLVVSMQLVVADLLEHAADNPGIHPGDQFMTNDPYIGTVHQPDVVVVAPVFAGDRLIAWTGSCVHHADVGGPVPGGINDEARSIFEEAVPIKPVKLVERGVMRRDIEREFVGRSRRPDLEALDLLGQVAANRATIQRLTALVDRSGVDVVVGAMEQLLDATEARFRALLTSLPDGRWRHVVHLEHGRPDGSDGDVYAVRLTLTKRGDGLTLDFGASDGQAPGAINASRAALWNFALAAVLIHLCPQIPWTAGAVRRAVEIRSRSGTVVHAAWPAGVAMSTAAAGQAIRACVNACTARLLDASDAGSALVMAGCQFAGGGGGVISGRARDGSVFGTMTLDELSGGGGARTFADGADTSAFTTSPGGLCANVEVNEAYLPLLYLARRERADSGGPGRWRGGVGLETWATPHLTGAPIAILSFGQGLQHPQAPGVVGGEPGGQSGFAIVANGTTDLPDRLPMPTGGMSFAAGESHVAASQGGGGFGDPLERPPGLVADDVLDGLVSVEAARRDYAVVLTPSGAAGWVVDADATAAERAARRRARLDGREPVERRSTPQPGRRLSSVLVADGDTVVCRWCGTPIAPVGAPVEPGLVLERRPVSARGGFGGRYPGSERFEVRHLHCPGCALQMDVQVARVGDPLLAAIDTAPPPLPTPETAQAGRK